MDGTAGFSPSRPFPCPVGDVGGPGPGSWVVGPDAGLEDNEAVADYVLGFVDRHGLDSAGRLALSFRDDEVPERETLASTLDEVALIEIEVTDADQRLLGSQQPDTAKPAGSPNVQ